MAGELLNFVIFFYFKFLLSLSLIHYFFAKIWITFFLRNIQIPSMIKWLIYNLTIYRQCNILIYDNNKNGKLNTYLT